MHPQTAKYSAWIGVVLFPIGFLLAIIGLAAKSTATILASYFLFGIGGLLLFLALIFSIIGIYESTHAISGSDNKEVVLSSDKALNDDDKDLIKKLFLENDYKCNTCGATLYEEDIEKNDSQIIYCKCRNCSIYNYIENE